MIKLISRKIDRLLGRGEASITVPPLDGAFRPNQLLEEAEILATPDAPDCLAVMNGTPVVSSRSTVLKIDTREVIAGFDADISCLAGLPDGGLAAGLVDGRIALVGGHNNGKVITPQKGAACPTAMQAASGDTLFVTHGSSSNRPDQWKRDLMERNSSGSLWRVDLSTDRQTRICGDLAFPYGIYHDSNGLVVAESWRSRLVRIPPDGSNSPKKLFGNLPGYPARLSPSRDNGAWLSIFAPRSQLIEFVLREPKFRQAMMNEIEPDYWVAPALRGGRSFYEPLQAGGVKQLGIMKPWAPTRSYGMIVRLDENFQPVASFHSRADGTRHGVTSCMEHEGRLLMAVKGDNAVVSLPLDRLVRG